MSKTPGVIRAMGQTVRQTDEAHYREYAGEPKCCVLRRLPHAVYFCIAPKMRPVSLFALSILTSAGCMDGPFFAVKSTMPWIRKEWHSDEKIGPTFATRIEELQMLERQLPTMDRQEQQTWSDLLTRMIEHDTSSEIRRRAVRALAKIDGELSNEGLTHASEDDVDKVRYEAVLAWSRRKDETAQKELAQIAMSDPSRSVRAKAIEGLQSTGGADTKTALAAALEDDDPALQHQAILSLKKMTGENFGGDVAKWQTYLNDLPSLPDPSNVARNPLLDWLPIQR